MAVKTVTFYGYTHREVYNNVSDIMSNIELGQSVLTPLIYWTKMNDLLPNVSIPCICHNLCTVFNDGLI